MADALTIQVTPSPEAAQAVSLVATAQALIITDKTSHEAARSFLKGAKAFKRKIEEHFSQIKKPINAARSNVLRMEEAELAPVMEAIAIAERLDTAYVIAQQRIEREQAELNRIAAEAVEQAKRDEAAAEAEAAAAALEAASDYLSERESLFVEHYVATARAPRAALLAGFKHPDQSAVRLLASQKILAAIERQKQANAIRQQAKAEAAKPLVVDVAPVESQIGSVSGTAVKTYYGAECVDLMALVKAVAVGAVPLSALQANQPFLNENARSLRELFAWPGCRLTKKTGVAA